MVGGKVRKIKDNQRNPRKVPACRLPGKGSPPAPPPPPLIKGSPEKAKENRGFWRIFALGGAKDVNL
jgi:hypothetical protein